MRELKPRRCHFDAIELASLQQFRALRGNAVKPEPFGGIS
jgi:hypothetical protein